MTNQYSFSLALVSPSNRGIISQMSDQYGPVRLPDIENWANNLDLKTINQDYQMLLDEIKKITVKINLPLNQKIIAIINGAIMSDHFSEANQILARGGLDIRQPEINEQLAPKIVELSNIRRCLQFLNNLPGISGKPINIINLPEFG